MEKPLLMLYKDALKYLGYTSNFLLLFYACHTHTG